MTSDVVMYQKDGAWGWLIVVVATISQLLLGGIGYLGGVFYVLFQENLNSGTVSTSWLCALPQAVWFLTTPVGSIITNRYGYRFGAFLGGIISAAAISLSYFASGIGLLFLTYGTLTGLGFGINYTSCLSALNDYFDKYKTVATGIVTVGHNSAMVLYPFLIGTLDDVYGWQGTMLILGAITFNMCACASFMHPRGHFERSRKASERKPVFQTSVLRKSTFLALCLSHLLCNIGMGIYLLFLPSYVLELGFTKKDVALILSVYGIANSAGKIFFSFFGQHPLANATVLYSAGLTLTGLSVILSPLFRSSPSVVILPGLAGFFYGIVGAFITIVVFKIVGDKRFSDGVGLSMPFKAMGNLIGGPLGGLIFDLTGSCSISIHFAGAALIFSGVTMFQPVVYQWRKKKCEETIAEITITCENEDTLL